MRSLSTKTDKIKIGEMYIDASFASYEDGAGHSALSWATPPLSSCPPSRISGPRTLRTSLVSDFMNSLFIWLFLARSRSYKDNQRIALVHSILNNKQLINYTASFQHVFTFLLLIFIDLQRCYLQSSLFEIHDLV